MKLLRLIWNADVKPPVKIKTPPKPKLELIGWRIHRAWIDLVVVDGDGQHIAVRGDWLATIKQGNYWRYWPTGVSCSSEMYRLLDAHTAAIVWGVHADKELRS